MRRVAAALAGAAALLLGATPALAAPSPSPTLEPESPIQVAVTTLLPRAPQPGDAFQVKGTLVNTGSTPVTDLRVQLAVGDVVTARGDLHLADNDRPDTGRRTATRPLAGTLPAGGRLDFDVRTTVADLGLTQLGVYPLDVRAFGSVDANGRTLLGLAPTWVPFFGDVNPRMNKVAVLWPLVDKPRQAPNGRFVDDELAGSLSNRGRLGRLLYAASFAAKRSCEPGPVTNAGVRTPPRTRCEAVPVTFGVDPDLVSAVDLMANGDHYDVGTGSKRTRGTGKPAAGPWLASLRAQVAEDGGSVLALPYADPDVNALARTSEGREDITNAVRLGNQVVSSALSATSIDAVWPPAGVLTEQAGETLTPTSGRTAFVLDESAYPDPDTDPDRTPSARTALTGGLSGLTGLVADEYLSKLVAGTTAQGLGSSRLAEQRFIAETAIVAAERPGQSRTFLLAPPRDTDADVLAAKEALRDLGRLPWLCPVRLESLALGSEACSSPRGDAERTAAEPDETVRTTLRTSSPQELSQRFLAGVFGDRDAATQLTTAVLDSDDLEAAPRITALRTRLRQGVARAESAAWRSDPDGGTASAQLLHDEMRSLTGSVQLLGGKKLLLTSNKGTLQVSIANSLDLPVRVRVQFTFPAVKPVETGLLTVSAKRSVPASVKAEAQRSGQFFVLAQMYDRDGRPFGTQSKVLVRSTRYGRLALGVTIAAAAILFVAAGVRIVRRALKPAPPE